jgi:hypothetical protein
VDPNELPPEDGNDSKHGRAIERDRVDGDPVDRESVRVAGIGGPVGAAVGGLAGPAGAVVGGSAGSGAEAGAATHDGTDEPAEESTDPRPR